MPRARREIAIPLFFVLAAACTGGGSDTQDPAAACAGKPVPPHACVGGAREPRCNTLANGETRWQIDCIRQDATKPVDAGTPSSPSGISPCEAQACGATPAWDENDCVHGFYGEPSCSSIDRGACTWGRSCKPKPCTEDDPTCNVLHPERLGRACDGNTPCPAGSSCNSIVANLGDDEPRTVCILEPACDALTCAAGKRCSVKLSDPGFVLCGR